MKFFDGGVWRVDFVDGGGEMLDLSSGCGIGEGNSYEKMTVRYRYKNGLTVKVFIFKTINEQI